MNHIPACSFGPYFSVPGNYLFFKGFKQGLWVVFWDTINNLVFDPLRYDLLYGYIFESQGESTG